MKTPPINELERVDFHPTHRHGNFKLRAGRPLPLGVTRVPGGINFAIYSAHATGCQLVLFERRQPYPFVEIPFPHEFRIGNIYAMVVFGLDPETIEYGYRMEGPYAPQEGHRFEPQRILLDPYSKVIGGRDVWGETPVHHTYPLRSRIAFEDFDWESDRPIQIPFEDLIIYEMHVRGFTKHPSSGVKHSGTFAGIRQKIPYLKELGVNCIQLMPIFEFDELELADKKPYGRINYWGYNTVGFFAPKAGYASTGHFGMQVDELKALIKELHRNGIEVILDVVYNHTAEGNHLGPTISYRAIDNKTYYMLTPEGEYKNYSGTGNTLNCNHPVVRMLVLDSLRYWAYEFHIDGFRFDLASILGRDSDGTPLENPPLLETLALDPILANCKLIAEAWDAVGLYQVGAFPAYGRWAELNGKYRDNVRRFIKGEPEQVTELANRLIGSPDLYAQRGATASINFITSHDGFTLADLYAYSKKHNETNGENNKDGHDDGTSWNCGVEGPTSNSEILRMRKRMMKNAIAMLMLSHGVPMIYMGDEMARSQSGNNNAYCHDNPDIWLDWTLIDKNREHFNFFQQCIAFRKAHPVLRRKYHITPKDRLNSGYPGVSFHGTKAWKPEYSGWCRVLAFMLCGRHAPQPDNTIYVAMNMYWESLNFELPHPPPGMFWHRFADTYREPPDDIYSLGNEIPIMTPSIEVCPRSLVVLVAKKPQIKGLSSDV
jgi:glycogen operon protein